MFVCKKDKNKQKEAGDQCDQIAILFVQYLAKNGIKIC